MKKATKSGAPVREHLLPSKLLTRQIKILVAGCGGTGSAMATGLVYLHQALLAFGHPMGLHVTLVDGDKISASNCVRQPFAENEIGLYNVEVLATRINLFWGLNWDADARYVNSSWSPTIHPDFLISCVDSRLARKQIAGSDAYKAASHWLDLGNNTDTGPVRTWTCRSCQCGEWPATTSKCRGTVSRDHQRRTGCAG